MPNQVRGHSDIRDAPVRVENLLGQRVHQDFDEVSKTFAPRSLEHIKPLAPALFNGGLVLFPNGVEQARFVTKVILNRRPVPLSGGESNLDQ